MATIWIIFIIVFSHVIQGITGFAGTLLAMPWASMVLDFETARGMINLLTITSALVIVAVSYHHIQWQELRKMIALMGVGLLIGIWLVEIIDIPVLLRIYGVFVIAVAVHGLFHLQGKRGNGESTFLPDWALNLLLFLAGIIHGMYVSGGALIVIYAAMKFADKQMFRVTVAMIWIFLNMIVFSADLAMTSVTWDMLRWFLIALGPCLLATYIGVKLQKYFSARLFLKISYGLLVISGGSLLFF